MIEQNKVNIIINEIYTELFLKADPSLDYKTLSFVNKHIVKFPRKWFFTIYLDQKVQKEIMDKVYEKYRVPKFYRIKISNVIDLGYSPNTNKKTWKEAIEKGVESIGT